ncbi:hypothetical protein [Marinobacter salsuginis]|uniref:hypothetical protein n=1 Tax=Marinobacter salsuginis TaxID=418719 RepID=UPI00273D4A2B|nr:hypothetical protein [Marinobacter salsuginis]
MKNIIDSLLYTGELKPKGTSGSVVPTGKAYASLMDWKREIAREKSQLKREVFVIILTALIAFGTVKQALAGEMCPGGISQQRDITKENSVDL